MNFSTKIFLTNICIYLLVIFAVGITVTDNTYVKLKEQEIIQGSAEADNIRSNIELYLKSSLLLNDQASLSDYGESIVDLFSSTNNYLEVFDQNLDLLATNSPAIWNGSREELAAVGNGQRSFILRHDDNGRYYLFVCSAVEVDHQRLVISMVKDITHIDEQRLSQYHYFLKVGFIGLVFVALIVAFCTKLLIKPVTDLNQAAQSIAAGNYNERVVIATNDEVGNLALQFNLMAAEIESKIQQLEEESLRQQRFVDNLTHELRTPLTSIIGYAELLQKIDYQPETFQKGLGYIYSEGKRMLNLNKMLMELTYYREGELTFETYPMRSLCQEAVDTIAFKAQEMAADIRIEGDDFVLPMAHDLMKSVLINLLDNALKASEQGQVITILLTCGADQNSVAVIDQGRGMKAADLGRIKEPFYRVDKARSRQNGGLGLGVAIGSQIIERHGGTLHYSSVEGKGTTATITFPANIKAREA